MRGVLIAMGAVTMGYAVLGAVTDPDLKPGGVLLFLAAVLVAHDAVLLPVTVLGGAVLARFAPRWALPSVRAAAIVSVAVGVVALPLVLGYGRVADNPSILPLAYGRGLALILAMVWVTALASSMLARQRANRPQKRHHTDQPKPGHHTDQPTAGHHTDQPEADDRTGRSTARHRTGRLKDSRG